MVGDFACRCGGLRVGIGAEVCDAQDVNDELGQFEGAFSEGCDSGFQHRFVAEQFVVENSHHTGAGAGRNHDIFVVLEQLDCAASERLGVAPEASVEGRLAATGLRGGKVEIDTQAFQDIDRALTHFGVISGR